MSEPDPSHIPPSLSDPEKYQCYQMFVAGWKPHEIETETGVPANRIRGWMFKEKWTEQKAAIEKWHDKLHPPMSQPIVKAVAKNGKSKIREKYVEKSGQMAEEDVEHWVDRMTAEERLAAASNIAALNKVHRDNIGLNDEKDESERGHISLTFLTSAHEAGMVRLLEPEKVKEITDAEPTAK